MPASRVAGIRLRLARFSAPYRQRLTESGASFCGFLREHQISTKTLEKGSAQLLDQLLDEFVNHLHQHRSRRKGILRVAKHAILFVQTVRPDVRGLLKTCWTTVKAWQEQEPSQLRAPMPLVLMMAMLCKARLIGLNAGPGANQQKLLLFSALTGLAFFGLLRPGELLNLTREDIEIPNQLSLGLPCVTVRIRKPKNFRQLGHAQFAVVKQPDICNWITWVYEHAKPGQPLWPHGASAFRALFKQVCTKLLKQSHSFSPASLRAGGATFMFDQCMDVGHLRLAGRWASPQSLEHYIQQAKAQQLVLQIPLKVSERIRTLISKGYFLLALPDKLAEPLNFESLLSHGLGCFLRAEPLWKVCRRWGSLAEEV